MIYKSASKLAFIMIVFTVCFAFVNEVMSEKEFSTLAGMAFVYYFTRDKGEKKEQEDI